MVIFMRLYMIWIGGDIRRRFKMFILAEVGVVIRGVWYG